MTQVNIHVAKARLSELIQKVLLGEEVIIARDNKPLIKLVALKAPPQKRQLGLSKGKIRIAEDFDAPIDDFEDYT
jgi:antitoxin (DNA-binding transcriptional repressor) of toxin-antitoxin stability system